MRTLILGACAALALYGCASPTPPSPVVAEGDELRVTLAQLDERVKQGLLHERTEGRDTKLYELRSDTLDEWIEELVLAREAEQRGVGVDALLEAETGPVEAQEIQSFFDQNRERLPPDTQLADVEDAIRQHLVGRKRSAAVQALVTRANVRVMLDPPRIQVAAIGPSLGPADAPITIVEFGDFECPYCRRVVPVLRELLQRHPEDVRIVYRHLPLESIHPRARAAALASGCAHEQGQFWAFHDRVFEARGASSDAALRSHAEALGLDLPRYDACLASGTQDAAIDADIAAAQAAGISGTPAFVVNGVLLTGAHPVEVFERLIERDLAAAGGAP